MCNSYKTIINFTKLITNEKFLNQLKITHLKIMFLKRIRINKGNNSFIKKVMYNL